VHALLHARVEVLDTEREPVEPEAAERRDLAGRGDAGVHLDRDLGVGREGEVLAERGEQALEIGLAEVGRRAPAPVELREPAAARQVPGEETGLADQIVEVAAGDVAMLRDDDVAAAEEAALLAERQVRVERKLCLLQRVGFGEPRAVLRPPEARAELHRGRVRGGARPGAIAAGPELERGGLCGRGAHDALSSRPANDGAGSAAHPCTVSISASTEAIGVSGRMPWPRFMMWPGPRPSSSARRARSRTAAGGPSRACGS